MVEIFRHLGCLKYLQFNCEDVWERRSRNLDTILTGLPLALCEDMEKNEECNEKIKQIERKPNLTWLTGNFKFEIISQFLLICIKFGNEAFEFGLL